MTDRTPSNAESGSGASNAGKGKGKDKDVTESSSITDRLQASGKMALNAVTSSSQDWSGQMSGSKAAPGSSRIRERSAAYTGETSSYKPHSSGPGDSIRRAQENTATPQAFDQFVNSEPTLLGEQSRPLPPPSSAVAEQQLRDGAEVLQLLDGPSDELDMEVFAPDETVDDDGLTPQAAANLRDALFSPTGNQSQQRWDSLLNFTPDFVNDPGAAFDAQLLLGTSDPVEARSIWLHQWGDVLSAYTDHVWGDLEPLAAQARKEVEEASKDQASDQTPETKALDRLRQILAHVRGH